MTQTKEVPNQAQRGFSTLEMTIVMLMSLIVAAIAVPSYLRVASYLRSVGDLRSLNGVTAQAKMRAAADFTHARIYVDLACQFCAERPAPRITVPSDGDHADGDHAA